MLNHKKYMKWITSKKGPYLEGSDYSGRLNGRRMIRENLMEFANEEDRTQKNLRNYIMVANNTLFVPSETHNDQ
ncbi:9980_t:CDS:2 [Gigaspora margarita]|uniref:9980_t:CDS:1 n=1 Tax=Gigaspora margarita TaxID=4874 RepID=A0ABM8VZ81_GIGMA|nr:9980_t:CDS:2 [Gigaspora margarita]